MRLAFMHNITSTVTHEMRTPLSMMQNYIMLIQANQNDQKKMKQLLAQMQHQIVRLLGYINDLLDLKFINLGVISEKITTFCPKRDLLEVIIGMLNAQAKISNTKISFYQKSMLRSIV